MKSSLRAYTCTHCWAATSSLCCNSASSSSQRHNTGDEKETFINRSAFSFKKTKRKFAAVTLSPVEFLTVQARHAVYSCVGSRRTEIESSYLEDQQLLSVTKLPISDRTEAGDTLVSAQEEERRIFCVTFARKAEELQLISTSKCIECIYYSDSI